MLNEEQKKAIIARGSDPALVEEQINNFQQGFPFLNLNKPARVQDGILKLSDQEAHQYETYFEEHISGKKLMKFVPASGAASRMFKDLFAFLDKNEVTGPVQQFLDRLSDFAFYEDLGNFLSSNGHNIDSAEPAKIIDGLLGSDGLGYGSLPKGLLKFHDYGNSKRTAMEEHLVEGANYAAGGDQQVNLHFTVSPEHLEKFKSLVDSVKSDYEGKLGVTFNIGFSLQKKSTDTVAVDLENNPFLESDGTILFRPAGHGALLENLNDQDADIVFIKNIDNVVPDRIKADTILYKKVLGGVLLETQNQIFDYLDQMDEDHSESLIQEVEHYLQTKLSVRFSSGYDGFSTQEKIDYLKGLLDRPIKVCGMVVNQGEPGGGPFWVEGENGSLSLQIAEGAQVDMDKQDQADILKASTHFNPVDLVCGVSDRNGASYDLLKFRDPSTGFITEKSKDGRALKAQELPGLWNGAMAFWNTLFVEVPIITFNPVKTVNDLLREQHQNG